jgi:hypothetical protein
MQDVSSRKKFFKLSVKGTSERERENIWLIAKKFQYEIIDEIYYSRQR